MQTKPQRCSSISLSMRAKRRLDAIAQAGRRSRTATVELLMDAYLQQHPTLNGVVQDILDANVVAHAEQRAQDYTN